MKTFHRLAQLAFGLALIAGPAATCPASTTTTLTWTYLAHQPGDSSGAMWLLQDGRVLTQLGAGQGLATLTPNRHGSYAHGTWAPAGSLLLQKWAYSSAMLSDGRLLTCGGEYSGPGLPQSETAFCEVYDPMTQTSTQIDPPPGWTNIGDGPTAVLADGSVLIGNTQGMGDQCGLLDPSTLTWSIVGGDSDNEQGYVLLQTGDVLTTNVYHRWSSRYSPALGYFQSDANLPVMLGANSEIGPGITLMDGRVIWFGASGHTCLYTPSQPGQSGTWTRGPNLPAISGDQLVADDVPCILEPNGKVLLLTSGAATDPTFVEYDPAANDFAVVLNSPPVGDRESCRMLLLPNGHGLVAFSNGDWYDVAFGGGHRAAWAPKITSFPSVVYRYTTEQLDGTQLCGLSECSTYGDDNQQAENYPMVRFVSSSGRVHYLRATAVSTRSIAPGQPGSVLVNIPFDLPRGTYSVYVVAMGIPSAPVTVRVR